MKIGQYVIMIRSGEMYLFLGYVEKTRCIVADRYGNKVEVFLNDIKNDLRLILMFFVIRG